MKIQRKRGSKTPVKATPSAPTAREPYFERMQELMMPQFGEFLAPWKEMVVEPFEMRETEREFVVSAAMPGFKESEIEVRAEPWRLYLHATHEESAKKGEPVFEEHREFARWVEFPAEVNPQTATAALSKGVLEVTVEKTQAAKKVTVEGKAA